jgi:hypothetical protein
MTPSKITIFFLFVIIERQKTAISTPFNTLTITKHFSCAQKSENYGSIYEGPYNIV